MRKLTLTLISSALTLVFTTPSFAHQSDGGMRKQAMEALEQYGQQLYKRGDYSQAASVFTRILNVEANDQQARKYLKAIADKGYAVNEDLLVSKSVPVPVALAASKEEKKDSPATCMGNKGYLTQAKSPDAAPVAISVPLKRAEVVAASPVVLEAPAAAPVAADESVEKDLANIQHSLKELRQSLQDNSDQIKTIEKQLPQ